MAKLQDTSVLDYARSNGIAFDFLSLNPLEHIDQFQLPHPTSLSLPPESHFVDYISSLHAFLEHEIKAEKLDIGKSDAQFLSTVIHQARAEVDIADILPRQETLKIEPPLLKADAELDLSSLKRQSLLSLGSIKVPSPESGLQHLSVEASQRDLFNIPNELGDRIKGERLECKKESLRLIQNARCDGISVHDIEGIQSELGQGRGRGENQVGSNKYCLGA